MKNLKTTLNVIGLGSPVEVRMLNVKNKGTVSGYYNDYVKLQDDIAPYNGEVNIFTTMNSVHESILDSREMNILKTNALKTTKDSDISYRTWLFIDLDPVRRTGVSSSNAELKEAENLKDEIYAYLVSKGFLNPTVAMSGNGYHLLYPVYLENTNENTQMVRNFLKALDVKFSNDKVKVDTSTYNASRIIKLYGTVACKGENTKERPHRESYIIDSGYDGDSTISSSSIQSVIDEIIIAKKVIKLPEAKQKPSRAKREGYIDIPNFLKTNSLELSHTKTLDDGATCYVLKKCPWREHTNPDKGACIIENVDGSVYARCHHDSCSEETWKTLLKKLGLHSKDYEQGKGVKKPNETPAETILGMVDKNGHQFFYDQEEKSYVSYKINNGKVFTNIRDKQYANLLRKEYFQAYRKPVGKDSLQQVLDTLEAQSLFEGSKIEPVLRCKLLDDTLYYYIGDDEQSVVYINENGVEVKKGSSVTFIKNPTMQAQVIPLECDDEGATFTKYCEKHWKFKSKRDSVIHQVLLLTRFISDIPSPIVYYMGDRGSAKTTSMSLDKLFVDPATHGIKTLPRNVDDLVIILGSQYTIAFDNVEGSLSADFANTLCMASTHGSQSKRKLYTDNELADIKLDCRLSFTGINTITNRPDFLDRCITLYLERISLADRKVSDDVYNEFKSDLPYMLYLGFSILSKAIPLHKNLKLEELPRMADFAKWGYAIAEVLGYGGQVFLDYYADNQVELLDLMVEEDSMLTTLIQFVKEEDFAGTPTELLNSLIEYAEGRGINTSYGWSKTVSGLSKKINNSKSVLSMYGINVVRGKSNGNRVIELYLDEVA